MNLLRELTFNNDEINLSVNVKTDNKVNVWFKAKEIATLLKYHDTDQAIRKNVKEKNKNLPRPGDWSGLLVYFFQ